MAAELPIRELLLGVLIVWAAVFVRIAFAGFRVEKGSVIVLSPSDLRGPRDAALADFGIPDYGGFLVGNVKYPENNKLGCDAFDGDKPFKPKGSSIPTIVLIDRGDCYFTKKAYHVQQAGGAAMLVVDYIDEPLITMESPEETSEADAYVDNITIPAALIQKPFGDILKKAYKKGDNIVIKIDWLESMPHPDNRVEYEFWTNSNDECGTRCDEQMNFVKDFRGNAQILEKAGYTLFTPHYITWYCPEYFVDSVECTSQCINHGRYCVPDPDQHLESGYEGKDVVFENLRQLCVHRVANESNRSWVWWDYVTDFHIRCSMKNERFSNECAENVLKSLDLPIAKIKECMGNPEADVDNKLLKAEQDLQVGSGSRSDVAILPTLVINNAQYRGKLDRIAVLKAICAGFKETTEPPICLNQDLETNECLRKNGGCWQDLQHNVTACKDTFRGRVCECPNANGVQYRGDGYSSCEAVGPGRCTINNGGCWKEARKGKSFSACLESDMTGCRCPHGFRGNGYKCEDINECKEGLACLCDGCTCKNTWGEYECKCKGGLLYMKEQDMCIERSISRFTWFITFLVLAALAGAAVAGYLFYKYRFRSYMDSEIMAIMSQYMPLDSNQAKEVPTAAEHLETGSSA